MTGLWGMDLRLTSVCYAVHLVNHRTFPERPLCQALGEEGNASFALKEQSLVRERNGSSRRTPGGAFQQVGGRGRCGDV